jgi:uncharacterized membrane protein (DUF2068 family)
MPLAARQRSRKQGLLKFPGLIAIGIYMVLVAAVTVVYVMKYHAGFLYLLFPVFFVAAALGLMKMLRWAWALALAAVALFAGTSFWEFSSQHTFPSLMQGLINLVFFLYLVRTDVRENLK